ncbi:MAG TPA: class I SAM-dependent methyltransferase [Jatrophihabitans sp.]|uniref:class I SAM-dependent methyltransferase n=1 Tax=Jatrophihabitans sp. TaxID=1932789 RepID=UPI002F1F0053
MDNDYRALNLANWNERAPAHAASPGYALQRFRDDPNFLSKVVRFDQPRLGDISGLRGLHLQCHIGTDTLSLHRLGARMSGLDFSGPALDEARQLADSVGADINYVQADAYEALDRFGAQQFDLLYTGVGALCWLPDIARWGRLVADLLAPGGRLFIREGHPALWAIDDLREDHLLAAHYPYFETEKPVVFEEEGTYVETEVAFANNSSASWNHGIGEIITAVLDAGLRLTQFVEHQSVPWEALPGAMVRGEDEEWRLIEGPERLPLTYTLQAVKD